MKFISETIFAILLMFIFVMILDYSKILAFILSVMSLYYFIYLLPTYRKNAKRVKGYEEILKENGINPNDYHTGE